MQKSKPANIRKLQIKTKLNSNDIGIYLITSSMVHKMANKPCMATSNSSKNFFCLTKRKIRLFFTAAGFQPSSSARAGQERCQHLPEGVKTN